VEEADRGQKQVKPKSEVTLPSTQAKAQARVPHAVRCTLLLVGLFRAKTHFHKKHPAALAMWCSDGRFTHAVEELLSSLGEEGLDTLTLPGGPALLDLTSAGMGALDVVREAASFLIKAHATRTVVLVAHAECGYYRNRYPYEGPEAMRRRQLADIRGAARWLTTNHTGLTVRCFFASIAEASAPSPGVDFQNLDE
jgi:hypothetical protein